MRDIIPRIYYFTFPRWSKGNEFKVLLSSIISFFGGVGGAFLAYMKHPSAIYVWHAGLLALLPYLAFYIKGKYQKYMDRAWDVYY